MYWIHLPTSPNTLGPCMALLQPLCSKWLSSRRIHSPVSPNTLARRIHSNPAEYTRMGLEFKKMLRRIHSNARRIHSVLRRIHSNLAEYIRITRVYSAPNTLESVFPVKLTTVSQKKAKECIQRRRIHSNRKSWVSPPTFDVRKRLDIHNAQLFTLERYRLGFWWFGASLAYAM